MTTEETTVIERVRRVVMGEPEPGKGAFSHVDEVEAADLKATRVWFVWGFDETPRLPLYDVEPYIPGSYFPAPGGLRVVAVRQGDESIEATPQGTDFLRRMFEAEPAAQVVDPDRPGMHRTDSIDIGVIVSGEMITEAEDGSTVTLRPGDVYIQNGAMHNWRTNPENPAHIVFVMLGAERTAN